MIPLPHRCFFSRIPSLLQGSTLALCLSSFMGGCGELIFEPRCQLPGASDPYTPAAVVTDGEGHLLVLDADDPERYCGGSLRILNAQGGVEAMVPLRTPRGYEAHFLDLVVLGRFAYTLGRRYGYLFKISLDPPYAVTALLPDPPYARLFPGWEGTILATHEEFAATTLFILDEDLRPLHPPLTLPDPVGAVTTYNDPPELWLGFLSRSEGVWKYRYAPELTQEGFAYPLGFGAPYGIRALYRDRLYLYGLEENTGVLFLLDPATRAPLGAFPGLGKPVALLPDPAGRGMLVLERTGRLLLWKDQAFTVLLPDLLTPISMAPLGGVLWIAEFPRGLRSYPEGGDR